MVEINARKLETVAIKASEVQVNLLVLFSCGYIAYFISAILEANA